MQIKLKCSQKAPNSSNAREHETDKELLKRGAGKNENVIRSRPERMEGPEIRPNAQDKRPPRSLNDIFCITF